MGKTKLYHFDKSGTRHNVHEDKDGNFVIGSGEKVNGRVTSNPKGFVSSDSKSDNPFHGRGNGEWDHYAHSAEDL